MTRTTRVYKMVGGGAHQATGWSTTVRRSQIFSRLPAASAECHGADACTVRAEGLPPPPTTGVLVDPEDFGAGWCTHSALGRASWQMPIDWTVQLRAVHQGHALLRCLFWLRAKYLPSLRLHFLSTSDHW